MTLVRSRLLQAVLVLASGASLAACSTPDGPARAAGALSPLPQEAPPPPAHRSLRDGEAHHRAALAERLARDWKLDASQRARLDVLLSRLQDHRPPPLPGGVGPAARPAQPEGPAAWVQGLVGGKTFDVAAAREWAARDAAVQQQRTEGLISAAAAFYDGLDDTQQQQVREFLARGPGPGPRPPRGAPPMPG